MQPASAPPSPTRLRPNWNAWLLVVATAAVFWPVTRWIVAETTSRDQIRQALILLAAAAALVVWRHPARFKFARETENAALLLLAAAFALVGLAGLAGWPLLVLPGFALAFAGCLHALFGAEEFPTFRPLVAGAAALLVIIVVFPALDWPLRQLAALGSSWSLSTLGLAPQLTLLNPKTDPQLIISVAQGHFLVATECNGFGLITSGALVAILAGGISGRRWWTIALLVPAAVAVGFAVNVLRILVISTTARYFPDHYNILHEIAGTLALWLGLGLVGWLAWRPERPAPARVS